MPVISVKNEEIFYSNTGDSDSPHSLLLIHGSASDNTSFQTITSKLANYNCISIDLPQHGQSKGEIRKSVEASADFIEDFISVMQGLKLISDDITLMGCSMGGFISIELAIRELPYIKRLISLSSGADANVYSEIIPYIDNSTPETFNAIPLIEKSFGPRCEKQYIDMVLAYTNPSISPGNEVCYYDFNTVKQYNKLEQAKNIKIPALAITGDKDVIIPPICSIHLFENLDNCNISMIPFSGHTVILDAPEYIAGLVDDFIAHS